MSINIELVTSAISRSFFQLITGSLLTDDQIKAVSQSTIGSYFKDFLPEIKDENQNRIDAAKTHLEKASRLILELQKNVEEQVNNLELVIGEVEKKKNEAAHYAELADVKEQAFESFKIELEKALELKLSEEANKGKRMRQVLSIIIWLITLISGAALGNYWNDIF